MSGIISRNPDANSGVVGRFPPGHVIQTVHENSFQGSFNSSVTTWTATPNVASITPKEQNSRILVSIDHMIYVTSPTTDTDTGAALSVWRSVNGASYAINKEFQNGSSTYINSYNNDTSSSVNTEDAQRSSFRYLDSPGAVQSQVISYQIYFAQWAARGSARSNDWTNCTTWVLQEIANV